MYNLPERAASCLALCAALLLGPGPLGAATRVLVAAPVLDGEAAASGPLVARLVEDAAAEAASRLGPGYEIAYRAMTAEADCRVACFASGSAPLRLALVAEPRGDEAGRQAVSYALRDEADAVRALPALLAGLVIQVAEGGAGAPSGPGLAAVAELPLEPFSALFGLDPPLKPYVYDVAVARGGPAWAAMLGGTASFDPLLRMIGLRRPEGQPAWFAAVKAAATPGGSVIAADAQGQLWRLRAGTAAERLRQGSGALLRLAAFPDGSLLAADAGSKALALLDGRRRSDFAVGGTKVEPWVPVAVDAEGRAWIYDYESGLIRLCLADGSLVDAIKPILPGGQTPSAILPLSGGDFVLLHSQGSLSGHDRGGRLRWYQPAVKAAIDPDAPSPVIAGAAADPADGSIWLAETMAGRIWRLVDLEYASSRGRLDPVTARLLELDAAVAASPEDRKAHEARAAFLEAEGASELAHACRLVMAALFPGDEANESKVEAFGAALERAALLARARAVYGPLERLGPESARADYAAALKAFERYLASRPDDAEVAAERDRLMRAFAEREKPALPPAGPAPRFASAALGDIFPALLAAYREKPVGSCVLEYRGAAPASSLALRASIKDFTDYPSELRVEGPIAPGSKLELPIRLQLNRGVLELQEDLPVQVRLEADFSLADGSEAKAERVMPVLMRRRSALVWTEIGALASFVTPNEETVSSFAVAAAARAGNLPWNRAAAKAGALVRALGSLGMAYVEDPRSPFSTVAGGAADTVRFPRATLAARAGDCDDTSALLASCLEAVGVKTAILGLPGHVLVAFDAEEGERAAWQYRGEGFAPIVAGGRLWIPLESTVLGQGFMACWREGWRSWDAAAKAGKAELVALAEARASYPPLPLGPAADPPPLPSVAGTAALAAADSRALAALLLEPATAKAAALLAGGAAGAGPAAAVSAELNRAGVLAARLGLRGRAEDFLAAASRLDPAALAPRVNLYNARILDGDVAGAGKALEEALAMKPDSTALAGLYASWLESRGRASEAARYAEAAGPRTPLAATGGDAAARGAEAGAPSLAPWDY